MRKIIFNMNKKNGEEKLRSVLNKIFIKNLDKHE